MFHHHASSKWRPVRGGLRCAYDVAMNTVKIAVIGAGNAGVTLAAHAKLMGAPDVRIYDRHPHETKLISDNDSQVELCGNIATTGTVRLDLLTTDPAEVSDGANFFNCDTPASAHADVMRTFAPHLDDGDVMMFHPGRTGAVLEARQILNEMGIRKSVTLIESQTLLYACRLQGVSATVFGLKETVSVAGENPEDVQAAMDRLGQYVGQGIWKVESSLLSTSLANIGMLFHPSITLMNLARMQGPDPFMFYTDGASELVSELIHGLDMEKIAVGAAFGVELDDVPTWLRQAYGVEGSSVFESLQKNRVYHGLAAPSGMDSDSIKRLRYITEDVPCGLVPFSCLGEKAGVPTPKMDSVIAMAGTVVGLDFRASGRTLEHLGLAGSSVSEIAAL
jgi:opine dehydrogenase